MECKKEGNFGAKIIEARIIYNHYKADSKDTEVELEFQTTDAEQERGMLYLDLSQDYITVGNNKGKKQIEASMETLKSFGIDMYAQGKASIKKMVGMEVGVYGKVKGNYHNFYLNTRPPVKEVSDDDFAALFGSSAASPSPAAAQGVQTANPFANQGAAR